MNKDDGMSDVVHRLFLGHQEVLRAELSRARSSISNPTLKGDASEVHWRQMLTRFLPTRYRVSRGVVVDSRGSQSHAIDVIVHDEHFCPRFQDVDGSCFVPAESVYAVFEARQSMTIGDIKYASEKAESVRRLHRTSAELVERGEARPPRALPRILAGLVTLDAEWAGGLGEAAASALGRLSENNRLDLGCALSAGAFEFAGPGVRPIFYAPETALISFFIRLVDRLQKVGTVPAIDWDAYSTLIKP